VKNMEIFKAIKVILRIDIAKKKKMNEILNLTVKDHNHCLLKIQINIVRNFLMKILFFSSKIFLY